MCDFEPGDFDQPEFQRDEFRRSKRERPCYSCGRPINKGERYLSIAQKVAGEFLSIALCEQCHSASQWLIHVCGGYMFDDVPGQIKEHAREYLSIPLARIAILGKRQWRAGRFANAPIVDWTVIEALVTRDKTYARSS